MYKVIVFAFAGIASGFTLVSIFSEDACMQVAGTIVIESLRLIIMSMAMFLDMFWLQSFAVYAPSLWGIMQSFLGPHTVTITH